MELKEYIKEVITQISESINEINGAEPINKTIVNPAFSDLQDFLGETLCIIERSEGSSAPVRSCKVVNVEFNVTLAESSSTEADGKIGLSVLGVGGSKDWGKVVTNNVKFSLPVLFNSARQPHD